VREKRKKDRKRSGGQLFIRHKVFLNKVSLSSFVWNLNTQLNSSLLTPSHESSYRGWHKKSVPTVRQRWYICRYTHIHISVPGVLKIDNYNLDNLDPTE